MTGFDVRELGCGQAWVAVDVGDRQIVVGLTRVRRDASGGNAPVDGRMCYRLLYLWDEGVAGLGMFVVAVDHGGADPATVSSMCRS